MQDLKQTIEALYPINACLLGEGYDSRLEYLKHLLDMEVIEVPSGTEFSTWTVPDEWVVRDAWIKFKGKKIVDYKVNPLSLVVGSLPFKGKVTREELIKHLNYSEKLPDRTPYVFKFYDKDWGFCANKNKLVKVEEGNISGEEKWLLEEGEYEVFIDTEYKPGTMKLGVHTIKGKTDKEILLFAHLDHPFQANDNLSGVACLLDVVKKIKDPYYTIKIIFCPETIGSIAYAHLADLSKVETVIAVDICGNDAPILLLKAFEREATINHAAHCALQMAGKMYRKAPFRGTIGSDETVFNDPDIGIPSICLSTHPYDEYHTDADTPEIISYEKIQEVADLIVKIIEILEKNYIPKKEFKGQLMRSRYGIQSPVAQVNMNYDYLFYSIDGKKSLAELCANFELNFDQIYEIFEKMADEGKITRLPYSCKKPIK